MAVLHNYSLCTVWDSGWKEFLILYVSEIKNDKIEYRNKIIKIDDFRNEPNVEKKFEKWTKTAEEYGFFNSTPYTQIENDAIIKGSENDLIPITLIDINPLNKKDKKAKGTFITNLLK